MIADPLLGPPLPHPHLRAQALVMQKGSMIIYWNLSNDPITATPKACLANESQQVLQEYFLGYISPDAISHQPNAKPREKHQ